jgi:hypothetical protein
LTPAQLAGGFGLPDAAPLANRIEQTFLRRLESLPDDTRRLLLTAAAEPLGDTTLLWRAADGLGLGSAAAVSLLDVSRRDRPTCSSRVWGRSSRKATWLALRRCGVR